MASYQRDNNTTAEGVVTLDLVDGGAAPMPQGFIEVRYWVAISATEAGSAVSVKFISTDLLETDTETFDPGGENLDGSNMPIQKQGAFMVYYAGYDAGVPTRKLQFVITPFAPLALDTLRYDYWIEW